MYRSCSCRTHSSMNTQQQLQQQLLQQQRRRVLSLSLLYHSVVGQKQPIRRQQRQQEHQQLYHQQRRYLCNTSFRTSQAPVTTAAAVNHRINGTIYNNSYNISNRIISSDSGTGTGSRRNTYLLHRSFQSICCCYSRKSNIRSLGASFCTVVQHQLQLQHQQQQQRPRRRMIPMIATAATTTTTTRRTASSNANSSNRNKLLQQDMNEEEENRFVALSTNIQKKLLSSIERYDTIMNDMKSGGGGSSSGTSSNSNSMIITHSIQQEVSSLSEVYKLYQQHTALHDEMISYYELLNDVQPPTQEEEENDKDDDEGNAEIIRDCQREIQRIYRDKIRLEKQILHAILPKDIEDHNHDAIIEIRAGTGGDEASLFAREIWDCYIKSIKTISKQWKVDILSETITDLGGLKDGTLLISGNPISIELPEASTSDGSTFDMDDDNDDTNTNNGTSSSSKSTSSSASATTDDQSTITTTEEEVGPYGFFKFESGVHRVQRIPINATRIHTSACSIAVLPSIKDNDSSDNKMDLLPMSELRIETMRSHGAGGQHVNTTDSAVRITHIPTGIQASIQDERSQHKNKAKALKLITARVRDMKRIEQEQQLGLQKSLLMGGGDRSERIRTYNYPQDRITDHRCKVSIQNIHSILTCQNHSLEDGLVICFLPYLKMMRRQELLQQLEDEK